MLEWAYQKVSARLNQEGKVPKSYRTAVMGAPAFIQSCGLVQAVAYFESKGEAYKDVLKDIESFDGLNVKGTLLQEVPSLSLIAYMRCTQRTQRCLVMLKRMVEAFPKEGD